MDDINPNNSVRVYFYIGVFIVENTELLISNQVDAQLLKSIRKLSTNADFRFIIAHILIKSGVERGFPPDNNLEFNEGKRSMGLEIMRWFDSMSDGRGDVLWGSKIRQLAINEHKLFEYHALELVEKQRQERK